MVLYISDDCGNDDVDLLAVLFQIFLNTAVSWSKVISLYYFVPNFIAYILKGSIISWCSILLVSIWPKYHYLGCYSYIWMREHT